MNSIEDGFVDIIFVFWEPLFLHYMFFADGLKQLLKPSVKRGYYIVLVIEVQK